MVAAGAVLISFSAVFVKLAHVSPTMAGFYRTFFGGIMLLNCVVMLNAQRIAGSPWIGPAMAILGSVLGVLQAALGVQAVLAGLRMAGVISGTS